MKYLKVALLTVTLLGLLSVPALAQTKVATVDMKKVFNSYYKTKLATAQLDKKKADLSKDLKDMASGIDKAQADYKQALEQSDDPAISSEERDKRKAAVADMLKDLNDRKLAADQYSRQGESTLADMSQRMSSNLVGEIRQAVTDKAKAGGYTLVLNSADTETVIYNSGSDNDLTQAVITQLNAGAPIDVTAPAPAMTPANP